MSIEDRLSHLLAAARQSGGDALLYDAGALRAQLSTQAPDLHCEIQALAAAIRMGAAARANGVADPIGERAAIAADIARAERLSLTVVLPAVEVACRSGIAPPPAAPAGLTGDTWIGESIMPGVVAAPAHPPVAPPPGQARRYPPRPIPAYHAPQPLPVGHGGRPSAPFYTRTWFYVAIGAVLIVGALAFTLLGGGSDKGQRYARRAPSVTAVSSDGTPAPAPAAAAASESAAASRDAASASPAAPAAAPAGGPTLAPYGGAMPLLQPQPAAGGGTALAFSVTGGGDTIDGGVVLPSDWNAGDVTVTGVGVDGGRSIGRGRLQLTHNGNVPMRVMTVQWQQDGAEAGPTMIGLQGQPGQADVQLSGAILCVMDGSNGQPVGCGRIG